MEELRDATPQQPTDSTFNGCNQLWQEISSKNGLNNPEICQNLLMVERFLKIKAQENLPGADKSAVNNLYNWASGLALPSPVFVESPEESSFEKQDESRRRSTLALSVISLLADLLPVHEVEGVHNVVIALASFTSETDPWTTPEAYTISAALLKGFVEKCEPSSFWTIVESTLKARIKPLFAKTKNPAITASGRKNYHPVPLPRFDLSTLDPESKPWRVHDVYITTTFSWIVTQYQVTDCKYLEAHFPLLVPPILTLIDDDSLPFKRLGCLLLSQLLIPIRESQSDILRRTNLSSVFEDAIRPSFHSLPTITPEDDSIQLLAAGYPALRSLLQTSYRPQPTTTNQTPSTPIHSKNEELFISTTTKTLRDHLIPSFHHISSTNTTAPSAFTSASFPHPRLSTLLLDQIATTCTDLSIHTTKYLQDIIPLIYSTLSNPFGTANPPLLLSAVSAARAVILTAYPRIWRWRGEFLGAICSCWIHTLEDEEESKSSENRRDKDPDENKAVDLKRLKKELQGLVYLIKYVLANPVSPDDLGQREAMGGVGSEIQMLVDADESLKECLLADVDSDDLGAFGLNPDPIK